MVHVFTLLLLQVAAVEQNTLTSRRSSRSFTTGSSQPLQPSIDKGLIKSILSQSAKPDPDHVAIPTFFRYNLPMRILLVYFDDTEAQAVGTSPCIDEVCDIEDHYRHVIATIAPTRETELRSFIKDAQVFNNWAKLHRADLVAALMSSAYQRAAEEQASERESVGTLKLEVIELRDEASSLKTDCRQLKEETLHLRAQKERHGLKLKKARAKLAGAEAQVEQLSFKLAAKVHKETVRVRKAVIVSHPYRTRTSLTASGIPQGEK